MGCKLNQAEGFQFSSLLEENGIAQLVSSDSPNADLVMINGCAVTCQAEAKTRQAVSKVVKKFPGAKVLVSGCYAQHVPSEASKLPGVDYIIGLDARQNLEWWQEDPQKLVIEVDTPLKISPFNAVNRSGRSRPFVKIQDGCDKKCTYCVIPSIRGASRSLSSRDIVTAAESYVNQGSDEIVLTGVRIGSWGRDLDPPSSLVDLIIDIRDSTEIRRIRLGSLEPWELNDGLANLILTDDRVCSHMHVPLQHTHPDVLRRMRRPPVEKVIRKIRDYMQRVPNLGIGTDVIVGFPGETDVEFERLLRDLTENPFSYIHVFSYSPRPDTVAGKRTDMVETAVMKDRSRILLELDKEKRDEFRKLNVGTFADVIPDVGRKDSEFVSAVSDNYLKVKVKKSGFAAGKCVNVKLVMDKSNILSGSAV